MITDKILYAQPSLTKDLVMQFGDLQDGVIGFAGLLNGGGIVEVSYFYGKDKPKNIIVVSSQVGCPAKCSFCELGIEKFMRNLSSQEIYDQAVLMLQQAHQYRINIDSVPHKVTIANSGEPLLNKHLIGGLEKIAAFHFSFKISTVFPAQSIKSAYSLADFAAGYNEPVQMQISLISTSENYRQSTAGIPLGSFSEIRRLAEYWKEKNTQGRKINISLLLAENVPCNAHDISSIFPTDLFRFRFRNYVPTENGIEHKLSTITNNQLLDTKKQFQDFGYEIGDWATPTATEQRFGLAANVIRKRYIKMVDGKL